MSNKHDPSTPAYVDTKVDAEALEGEEGRALPKRSEDTEVELESYGDTDVELPQVSVSEVMYQEGVPPQDHTQRVRAKKSQEPTTRLRVPDSVLSEEQNRELSSAELAQPSRRERKKARDKRAETVAMRVIVTFSLILIGIGAFFTLTDSDPPPPKTVAVPPGTQDPKNPNEEELDPRSGLRTAITETPDLPALGYLRNEGLTIGAEGLPNIEALAGSSPSSARVALESCRFAYGVWEFSPNRVFRFLTTCKALEGQVLVGAYSIEGSTVFMSTLRDRDAEFTTRFEVERPSKLITELAVGGHRLVVNQRVTVLRPGMDAAGFLQAFAPKNTIDVGAPKEAPAPTRPAPAPGNNDPVLDLLKGGN